SALGAVGAATGWPAPQAQSASQQSPPRWNRLFSLENRLSFSQQSQLGADQVQSSQLLCQPSLKLRHRPPLSQHVSQESQPWSRRNMPRNRLFQPWSSQQLAQLSQQPPPMWPST